MKLPLVSSLLLSPFDALQALTNNFLYAILAPTALFAPASTNKPAGAVNGQYLLGLGIADITGPVVETNLMGYASLGQTGTGLHMRQRVRAFIVAEPSSPADANAPSERILLLNADIAMGDTGVRRLLLAALSEEFGNSTYHKGNVALVGTHQHSGVGGYLENLLPQITALGLSRQSLDAIVDGCLLATRRAHASLAPGTLASGTGFVSSGSRNRSPTAYLANPAEERARYADAGGDEGDQEWGMALLRFGGGAADNAQEEAHDAERGFLSFFAVHGTSIYENNTLVSSDNKGMAAYLYEASEDPRAMPGNASYVAGFVQGAVGDTSPNTLGAFCESPGKPYNGLTCVANSSTCGGAAQQCHGRGPAFTSDPYGFTSNAVIGSRQADAARAILHGGGMKPVKGNVRSLHVYVDMSQHEFTLANGTTVRTCPAAMGFSFAGGTTDGPGAFDFVQGDNKTSQNPFWEVVKVFITPAPPPEQIACHYPKPILLNTGYAHEPYEWSPRTVDVQILKVGNFGAFILLCELTTMAGRRIREAVRAELISTGILGEEAHVVVAGPANTYGHYITTREEYEVQRYEGASTLYGPYTLEAYIAKYTDLVPFLADGHDGMPASDEPPAEQISKAISLQTSVKFDAAPIGKHFGQILKDVVTTVPYHAGDTVFAEFVGANPRNNLRLEGTYLSVDHLISGAWEAVRSDSHPSTIYRWTRESTILGTSTVNVSWTIESDAAHGTYRIRYFGDSKPLIGSISPFIGTSSNFTLA
ncbi:Neutral/alkaline nonlysosomal ceramidase [Mycena belliarum]|uniref:Neutral ceramidase n=1 Tax=Mycena belliarum TaxID=1033014 RepID=A0AAD6TRQ0_9AGAR|nr:Neutral/alkaline nonlysosomal ceramidase [Mycena belliae]